MNLRAKLFGNWLAKAIGSGIIALLALGIWGLPFTQGLTYWTYDLWFALRPDIHPDEALVVYMDEESRVQLRQPVEGAWDRAKHLQLLNELFAHHAKAVVFDVLMDEPWPDKKVDEQFAAAIRSHGRVVLGAIYHYSGGDGQPFVGRLQFPVEPLRSAALWGAAVYHPDTDGTVRQHSYDDFYTNIAWQAAALLGRAPPNRATSRWINFYGPRGTIPHVSYHQVLEPGALSDETISNKVVFVGKGPIVSYEGSRSSDEHPTPYTRWHGANFPGVELNATACLNFLQRDWLSPLPLGLEFSLILLAALGLGFGLPLLRFGAAAGLAAAISFAVAAIALLTQHYWHWWFSWGVISFVEVPAALGWMAVSILSRRSAFAEADDGLPDDGRPRIPDHEMVRRFGSGSYGEVWLARNVLGTYRAVKIIFRDRFPTAKPFEREFRGAKSFEPLSRSHEGFVDILQLGRREKAGYFYYVMELADDQNPGAAIDPERYVPKTLANELARREKIPCEECVQIGLHLAAALQKLHEAELVHRDIKPSNIIFVGGVPKLADIGLVAKGSEAQSFVGTEGFMPPEGPGSPQADIYSLGKVLYEIAMGRDRLSFPELPTTLADNPEREQLMALNEILIRACRPNPIRRYATAEKMHADLKRLANKLKSGKIG